MLSKRSLICVQRNLGDPKMSPEGFRGTWGTPKCDPEYLRGSQDSPKYDHTSTSLHRLFECIIARLLGV